MTLTRRSLFAAASGALAVTRLLRAQKPRLRRKDSFLGMHFDLHPGASDTALGRDLSEQMVEDFLSRVKPDYVQYDCKGHVGFMAYLSKVGTPAGGNGKGIIKDSLEIWRKVTARHGVSLYIHFSGVWDSQAIKLNPKWATVNANGQLDPNNTSTFSPYVDELMIPELKEAAERYDLDGAWVDGECWAVKPDYSETAAKAFREATGIKALPKGPGDPGWLDFLEFNRARFRKQVKHYVDELHRARPAFQIASNWLYSTMVPERPDLPVDYISGDYLGNASISTARLEARYMASTGKPWDLMAWGFQSPGRGNYGWTHKPACQLKQESAVVLAQGGGFQIYYTPTRAGYLDEPLIKAMEEVARFCRERQAMSHKSEPVEQIGVLFSRLTLYNTSNKMFGGWGSASDPARGIVDALIDAHYSVDVIPDWKVEEVAAKYPLIVVPDWAQVGVATKASLVEYARKGGKLLVVGVENADLFSAELGVRVLGDAKQQSAFLKGTDVLASVNGVWLDVEPQQAKLLEHRYPAHDTTRDAKCAATVNSLGQGQIAAIYGPLGTAYAAGHIPQIRQFIQRVVEKVFTPMVQVQGPPTLEVSLRRKQGRLLLHIINCTGMQVSGEYVAGDFIPPVGPVRITVRLPQRPPKVTLEPGGQVIAGEYVNGEWTGTVERLELHNVVAF